MVGTATFSDCGLFRYDLTRRWRSGETVVWLMLNPSTATAETDDATIRKCIEFSRRFGFGGLVILNLFAFRSRHPSVMRSAADPIGPLNDEFIERHARAAGSVICAWGSHGRFKHRDEQVTLMLRKHKVTLDCLHFLKDGSPGHPLMLSYDRPIARYIPTWPIS
jgi:hypothetical protein